MTLNLLVTPQPMYAGAWVPRGGIRQTVRVRLDHDDFLSEYGRLWGRGYRLSALTAHVEGGQSRYSGVWNASTLNQFLGLARTYSHFLDDYGEWWSKGFRLVALATHEHDGNVYYSGVWNPSTSGQFLGLGRSHDDFVADYGTWWSRGFRLKALRTEVVSGEVRYDGVWNPGAGGQFLRLHRTHDGFLEEYSSLWGKGFRLAALTTCIHDGIVRYSGVWNPSVDGQYLSLNQTVPDFEAAHTQRYRNGWGLSALTVDRVEALDIGGMGKKLGAAYAGKCVGYAATIAAGGSRVPVAGGLRRTSADPPSRAASTAARVNVASVSKTATAVGVLRLLAVKKLSIHTRIHHYLPGDWSRGPDIDTITFAELLTHTSGIRHNGWETYENLKATIAKGIVLADKQRNCQGNPGSCYQNANYALFRIIVPYLNGYSPPATNRAAHVSAAFMAYMNQHVFAPAGIDAVTLKPVGTDRTLAYPFPAGNVHGTDFGDWTDTGGGGGYQLSSDELAALLRRRADGTLLPLASVRNMDRYLLGWQGTTPVRHGSVFWHGGGFPIAQNPGALGTIVMSFTTGVQVGVEINSETKVGLLDAVLDAYDGSWVVLP